MFDPNRLATYEMQRLLEPDVRGLSPSRRTGAHTRWPEPDANGRSRLARAARAHR